VTRGWLPQRAGLPVLNGGGAAAAVPPRRWGEKVEGKGKGTQGRNGKRSEGKEK